MTYADLLIGRPSNTCESCINVFESKPVRNQIRREARKLSLKNKAHSRYFDIIEREIHRTQDKKNREGNIQDTGQKGTLYWRLCEYPKGDKKR